MVSPTAWHASVLACRDEQLLTFDMFDCLFGVDAAEAGMDVVAILYSTSKGRRIMLRTTCEGGREAPRLGTVTDVYPGANWMEREAFDMFGIEFDDHPGLLPRILCVENFEGWPLRKDFALASRVAKPWPGVSEPVETDEDGNVIIHEPAIGEAAGPSGLDEIIAKQAREANADPEAIEAGDGADGGSDAAKAEPAREEVELDQDVYDELIAAGKSERIARSKAKAAFIKAQRKAEREAAAQEPAQESAQAPAEDADAAAEAKATAEATRTKQAEARAAKASEAAQATDGDATADAPGIPEGTTMPRPDADEPEESS